jgi:hypothetical protein
MIPQQLYEKLSDADNIPRSCHENLLWPSRDVFGLPWRGVDRACRCITQVVSQSLEGKEAENLRAIQDIPRRDGLVPVSDHSFSKLVLAKARPYHLFVLFTTANLRGECSACEYDCCLCCGSPGSVVAAWCVWASL